MKYLKYWNINNLNEWSISQKLTKVSFKLVANTSQFSKDFKENYNKDSNEGYFFEIHLQYSEKLLDLHNDLLFLLERMNIEKLKNL